MFTLERGRCWKGISILGNLQWAEYKHWRTCTSNQCLHSIYTVCRRHVQQRIYSHCDKRNQRTAILEVPEDLSDMEVVFR